MKYALEELFSEAIELPDGGVADVRLKPEKPEPREPEQNAATS